MTTLNLRKRIQSNNKKHHKIKFFKGFKRGNKSVHKHNPMCTKFNPPLYSNKQSTSRVDKQLSLK